MEAWCSRPWGRLAKGANLRRVRCPMPNLSPQQQQADLAFNSLKPTVHDRSAFRYSGIEQCPPDGQGCYNVTASKTTAGGHRVVRSAGYYLDQLGDLDPDHRHHGTYWGYFSGWKFYSRDPVEGMMIAELGARPDLVIGGKANMVSSKFHQ